MRKKEENDGLEDEVVVGDGRSVKVSVNSTGVKGDDNNAGANSSEASLKFRSIESIREFCHA